ncbi:hypothetical protein [Bacillus sp. T33-2]|uniref:hypothetical protein n=1 Tax=Bacillus sp. T33-2 TaxID=2054168 RepID=UPI000C761837|nr:hypothetical protein [Bacillus sp. T33-2]PLR95733.1 hypothetical protein CVD19_13415 [Bacillus sp. T33-2]
MKIESVTTLINKVVLEEKYNIARELIERDWERLIEYKNYQVLNGEAKQFLKFIKEEKENAANFSLTHTEKKILNLLNQTIRDMNLRYAKRLFEQHQELIYKPTGQSWLTSEARYICDVWNKHK